MSADEAMWKRRFLILTVVRLVGILLIVLGLAVAFTDLMFAGGHRIAGALLIVAGTIDSAFGPVLLKQMWRDDK